MNAQATVGIVGLGGMGAGIATRLLDQGVGVVLWNRSPGALAAFEAHDGVTLAATPGEAAACGQVITFVANDAALSEVVEGADGIAQGLPPGGVHMSMSSVSPDLVGRLADLHRENGSALVSAPVFGRPEAAAKGLLWVALSGSEPARLQARTVLEKASRSIHDFGNDPKSAISAKIAGNFIIASAIEAMSEAFAGLEAHGHDARTFHDMMSETIFGSVIHQNYGKIILDQSFSPPGFKLALGAKDVGLALDMAGSAGVDMPFGEVLRSRFAESIEAGFGDSDWNAISTRSRKQKT